MDMTYTVHHNMHDCMEAFQLDVTPQYLLFVNPVSVPVIWGKLLIWDPKEEEWINHQNENNNARPLQPKVIKHPKTRKQNVEHADRVNLEWNCLPSSDNKFTSKIGIMSHHNKPSSLGDEHNHSHSLLEFPNYKYIIYIYIYSKPFKSQPLNLQKCSGHFFLMIPRPGISGFPLSNHGGCSLIQFLLTIILDGGGSGSCLGFKFCKRWNGNKKMTRKNLQKSPPRKCVHQGNRSLPPQLKSFSKESIPRKKKKNIFFRMKWWWDVQQANGFQPHQLPSHQSHRMLALPGSFLSINYGHDHKNHEDFKDHHDNCEWHV